MTKINAFHMIELMINFIVDFQDKSKTKITKIITQVNFSNFKQNMNN